MLTNQTNISLVTGATGFVGRALCARLGGPLRALSRTSSVGPWQEHVALDLAADVDLDPALTGVDTVYHLAGVTHDVHRHADESVYERTNVDGTRRLLVAAKRAGVTRVVFLSSVKAIGEGSEVVTDESTEAGPVTAYGRTKLAAERLVLDSGIDHVCVLRSTLVYGPGTKGNISRMVKAIKRGLFPPVPEVGNKRSMVHVDDLAVALMSAAQLQSANGRSYIITDGRPYSTREIYEWIVRALGRRVPPWTVPWFGLRAMACVGDVAGGLLGRPAPIDTISLNKLMGSSFFVSNRAGAELLFEPRNTLDTAMPDIVRSLV